MIAPLAHLSHPIGRTIRTKTLSKPVQLTRPSTGLLSHTYFSTPTNACGLKYQQRLLLPTRALSTDNRTTDRRGEEQKTPSVDFGGGLITLLFGASLLSERLNGMGVVQQLELHQGLHPFIVASIVFLFAAAFWPSSPSSSPTSSIDDEVDMTSKIRKWATRGIYLAMAGTLLGELLTGKGALCLLDVETGIEEISDVEAIAAFIAMFLLTGPRKRSKKKKNSINRSRDME